MRWEITTETVISGVVVTPAPKVSSRVTTTGGQGKPQDRNHDGSHGRGNLPLLAERRSRRCWMLHPVQ
jgi:hypothetical protein